MLYLTELKKTVEGARRWHVVANLIVVASLFSMFLQLNCHHLRDWNTDD
jgi:hypothetical protein